MEQFCQNNLIYRAAFTKDAKNEAGEMHMSIKHKSCKQIFSLHTIQIAPSYWTTIYVKVQVHCKKVKEPIKYDFEQPM